MPEPTYSGEDPIVPHRPDTFDPNLRIDESPERLDVDKARSISDALYARTETHFDEKEVADKQKQAREYAALPDKSTDKRYAEPTLAKANQMQSELYDNLEDLYDSNPDKFTQISAEEFMTIAREFDRIIYMLESLETRAKQYEGAIDLVDKKIESRDSTLLTNGETRMLDWENYYKEYSLINPEPDFFETTPHQHHQYFRNLFAFIRDQKLIPAIERYNVKKQAFLEAQKAPEFPEPTKSAS